MRHALAPLLLALLAGPVAAVDDVAVVDGPPADARSSHYPGNREPLRPSPFVKLPVGAVRPDGWLRKQLELQADGFHGHLTEISRFLEKEENSWLDPGGQGSHGWEEVPYWLKGFADCAYLLGRDDQIAEAKVWIEGALNSRRDDGFFGPRGQGAAATVESTEGEYDLWPNMVMLKCLQSYYEYTGDDRVLDLMTAYFRWERTVPDEDFLPPYWQQQRGADNLTSVYWLYNRTGEPWLLDLAAKIHRNTADWTSGVPNWHNVNMAEAFGGPTFFWPQSGDEKHLNASYRNYETFRTTYGQVPGGMFGGDENCRPGYDDPRQAVETCGLVEMMFSCEQLLTTTGDPLWADRCEDVAFNMLPAALTAEMDALRYLTAPNMATADRTSHAPGIQNGGPMFAMDPTIHRCCQHNFGHGWPYLAEHLWLATADDGLALAFPLAGEVEAAVGDGAEVTMTAETHYPFDDAVELTINTAEPVRFPLYLRVPGWCDSSSLAINGEAVAVEPEPGRYLRIDRTWSDGDAVRLALPMAVKLRTWEANHDSVSVDRGPLTYSLEIGEQKTREGGSEDWPGYVILPATDWNYGLVLDGHDPAASFEVVRRDWPDSEMPWTLGNVPVMLKARGKKIPEWQLDAFELVAPLQDSPVRSSEPVEPITLVPMGAARLRISAFPVIGEGPDAHEWEAPAQPLPYEASASHCFDSDTVRALKDRIEPRDSADRDIPRFTWWPHKGTTEWVQYDFDGPIELTGVSVYWFDDTGFGGGCALPESVAVLARKGGEWVPVAVTEADPIAADRFNALRFQTVSTDALRLEVRLRPGRSAGILEWRIE